MKIKALWGFRGDAPKLKASSADVKAGQVFEGVDPEYAHVLIGKGLVVQLPAGAAPKEAKPAKPTETKQDTSGSPAGDGVATAEGQSEDEGEAGASDDAAAGESTGDEKQQLIQQLEAAGAEFDRRWGIARLAAALEEAQKSKEPS